MLRAFLIPLPSNNSKFSPSPTSNLSDFFCWISYLLTSLLLLRAYVITLSQSRYQQRHHLTHIISVTGDIFDTFCWLGISFLHVSQPHCLISSVFILNAQLLWICKSQSHHHGDSSSPIKYRIEILHLLRFHPDSS